MSGVDLHWFLPINGDSRQLVGGGHGVGTGSAGLLRQASLDYLASVAQAAEQVGFTAARTPTGLWCEDAWLTTAMLVGHNPTMAEVAFLLQSEGADEVRFPTSGIGIFELDVDSWAELEAGHGRLLASYTRD